MWKSQQPRLGKSSGRIVIENLAVPVSALTLSWPVFISFSDRPPELVLNKFHNLLLVRHLYAPTELPTVTALTEDPGSVPSSHVRWLKTTVTPAPGNSVPPSGLHGPLLTCGAHTYKG